jgi:hypothetical protein
MEIIFVEGHSRDNTYDAIAVRLVYPMEDKAMRFFNMIGNKFFAAAFTWLLGQPIRDTLCGTKVIWRKDYERLIANRSYFGNFDPFGDFDLLFGAAKLNLKIQNCRSGIIHADMEKPIFQDGAMDFYY